MTSRTAVVSLVVAALLASGAFLVTSLTSTSGQSATQASEQEQIDRLWKVGENANLFGKLDYNDGVASGKFIQFNYSESDGAMSDVRVNTTDSGVVPIISSLATSGLEQAVPHVDGPLFRVDGTDATLLVHNNPSTLIGMSSDGAGVEIALSLPSTAKITKSTEEPILSYNLSVNGVQLWLGVSNADVRVVGKEMTITFNDAGAMVMRQVPQFENVGSGVEDEINSAIGAGLIGSETWVLARSNAHLYEWEILNGVDTNVTSADVGMVTLEASAPFEGGSIIVVNVDKGTIDPAGDVTVTVDGDSVTEAGVDSVIESASAEDLTPSYAMLEGNNTSKFLIYLPDLSTTNTVVIESS